MRSRQAGSCRYQKECAQELHPIRRICGQRLESTDAQIRVLAAARVAAQHSARRHRAASGTSTGSQDDSCKHHSQKTLPGAPTTCRRQGCCFAARGVSGRCQLLCLRLFEKGEDSAIQSCRVYGTIGGFRFRASASKVAIGASEREFESRQQRCVS
jgi:hypothetical protein